MKRMIVSTDETVNKLLKIKLEKRFKSIEKVLIKLLEDYNG